MGWQLGEGSAGGRGGRWEGLEGVNEEAVGADEWVDGTLVKRKSRQCLFNKPLLKSRKSTCMSCATAPFLSALPNTHSILSSFLSVHLLCVLDCSARPTRPRRLSGLFWNSN